MRWAGRLGIFSLSKGYDYWLWLAFLALLDQGVFCELCWGILLFSRLLSLGKRTSERNNVSFNGHMHKEHCMDCNHLILRCSPNEHISRNSIRWLKKPKEELRLQGELQSFFYYSYIILALLSPALIFYLWISNLQVPVLVGWGNSTHWRVT